MGNWEDWRGQNWKKREEIFGGQWIRGKGKGFSSFSYLGMKFEKIEGHLMREKKKKLRRELLIQVPIITTG